METAGRDVSDSFVGECTTSHRHWNITVRVATNTIEDDVFAGDTVTDLPVIVGAPAGDCAVRNQRTRMETAGCDVSDSFVGECTTSDRDWNITVRVATVTELPVNVPSPAGDCAVRNQRTRIVTAGCDVSDSFVGECTTSHRHWNITVRVATVTELPVIVVAPAGDCAI